MKEEKCYMCDRTASSREHVPPLCLFPEIKDTKGVNFRKNLITVPSCDIHNSKKSDDDEFLMLALSGLINNNPVGQFHQLTKANRALKRKNKDFLSKQILRNHKYHKVTYQDGSSRILSVGHPDIERLVYCLELIARGLYYHESNSRFEGQIQMIPGFIEYTDETMQTLKLFLKKRIELEKELDNPEKGDNPEVFNYQFFKPDNFGLIGLRLIFYGTAEVYVSFKGKKAKEPFDLGIKLALNGVHTIIDLEGEKFEFNKKSSR